MCFIPGNLHDGYWTIDPYLPAAKGNQSRKNITTCVG